MKNNKKHPHFICSHTCKNDNALYIKNVNTCICRLCGEEITSKNWSIYSIQREIINARYSISSIRNRHLTKSQQNRKNKLIRKPDSFKGQLFIIDHMDCMKIDNGLDHPVTTNTKLNKSSIIKRIAVSDSAQYDGDNINYEKRNL